MGADNVTTKEIRTGKKRRTQAKKAQISFWEKYKLHFFIAILSSFILYILIYLFFKGNGIISTGKDLSKSDWLSFLGSYLSFVGTVIVSLIAILQTHYYVVTDEKKKRDERKRQIQPIFSIKIVGIDEPIDGTAEVINLENPEKSPKHQNVKISIENVNREPVMNLIVFDEKYITPLLKPNEAINIYCAYYDSADIKRWPDKLIKLTDEIKRNEQGIPEWFNINYEDVDGQSMYQTFVLKEFEGEFYYSLVGIQEA